MMQYSIHGILFTANKSYNLIAVSDPGHVDFMSSLLNEHRSKDSFVNFLLNTELLIT